MTHAAWLATQYAALIACSVGFAVYIWSPQRQPRNWLDHLAQWWWSYGAVCTVYTFRLHSVDTIFRFIGEGVGMIGALAIGYTIGYSYIRIHTRNKE